jgi:hypothetical protein
VLAGCLARVAGWVVESRAAAWLPAMASRGRLLDRRIRRLTDRPEPARGRALAGIAALVVIVGLGVLAPPVTTATGEVRDRPPSVRPTSDLAHDLAALTAEMRDLRAALAALAADPALRPRIERLDARWERLRRRAANVESLTEETDR